MESSTLLILLTAAAVVVGATATAALFRVAREIRRAAESLDMASEAIDEILDLDGGAPSAPRLQAHPFFAPRRGRAPSLPDGPDETAMMREWAAMAEDGGMPGRCGEAKGGSLGSVSNDATASAATGGLPAPWRDIPEGGEKELAEFLSDLPPGHAAILLAFVFGCAGDVRDEGAETARRTLAGALGLLDEETARGMLMDVGALSSCRKEDVDSIADALAAKVIAPAAANIRFGSPAATLAGILNHADRNLENRLMCGIEETDRVLAERIKGEMFTFDDLIRIDACGIQILLRSVEKDKLAIALKGGGDVVKELFFKNMSERAGKMLQEDMQAMGPVRLRDVDSAQGSIVAIALELAGRGQIVISEGWEGDSSF